MTTITRFVVAAWTTFALVTTAGAQTAVLSSLDVQTLVAANTPDSNARLARHFTALADKYSTDAASHKAMVTAYTANANHTVGGGLAIHCKRLSEIATQSAVAAREMASYHDKLAAGASPAVPKDAARLDSGKGAPAPTATDLHGLATAAHMPAEHHALEEYFTTLARKSVAEAETHKAMAGAYRAGARKGAADPAAHCDRLAKLATDAGKEASEAATLHRQLANVG